MKITYKLIRSSRKTIAIQITPAGEVVVRCPGRMRTQDVQRFVESKADWIRAHLAKFENRPALQPFTQAEIKALADKALQYIPGRVKHFAPMVGVSYGRITIRNQKTRWGSCSGPGNLNFNCLLMLLPPEIIDYVVVHELCHRKEMNHSPKFWAHVERILPNYRTLKQQLKNLGGPLIARLP